MPPLLIEDLGRMEYLAARSVQERILKQKQQGDAADRLLLVEHPHVFTLGLSGKMKHVIDAGEIPLHATGRGGDITYHGPGQLVIYPLVDLKSTLRKRVHSYLRNLEMSIVQTLSAMGIEAARRPPWTGVWIGERKIASIGIAVRRGITCHGAALNVTTDLSYFKRIVACGLPWAEMTSMTRELKREINFEWVKEVFVQSFVKQFRYRDYTRVCQGDIQTGSRSNPPEAPIISA